MVNLVLAVLLPIMVQNRRISNVADDLANVAKDLANVADDLANVAKDLAWI